MLEVKINQEGKKQKENRTYEMRQGEMRVERWEEKRKKIDETRSMQSEIRGKREIELTRDETNQK